MEEKIIRHGSIIPLAGGFSIGAMNITGRPPEVIFSYTGFSANDELLIRYLKKKGFDVPYYHLDDKNLDIDKLIEEYQGKLDFIHGIPPCSGLSQAAQRKAGSRGTAAPNDWMYESATFILGKIQPTIYAFENAPGLYTGAGDDVRNRLIKIGEDAGYAVTFYKTNTIKHGIPQFRPRTFALFHKGPYAPILHSYNKPLMHISEYLKQIPDSAAHQDEYMTKEWDITTFEITKYLKHKFGDDWRNHLLDYRTHLSTYNYLQRTKLLDDFQEWQLQLPEDERSEIVTKNVAHIKKKMAMGMGARINYRVLMMDREYVYAVIGEMMGKQVHPDHDRIMNIREYMHLMGLPHDYEVVNPADYVKITQNIPVCTALDMTTEIVAIIKGERLFHDGPLLMQDNTKPIEIETHKAVKLF